MVHLWLRAETKPNERRSCLTPSICKELLSHGYKITVEKCSQRIFPIEEFQGCEIVEGGSWVNAPTDAYIIGLKELPESSSDLVHKHIFFAHCYKNQDGYKDVLCRFKNSLLDLEFLTVKGRRVAAFGYYAGFAGCAMGVYTWAVKKLGQPMKKLEPFENEIALVDYISNLIKQTGTVPTVMVMGAKGRCGTGASDFAKRIGLNVTEWDMAETAKGGPFAEILDHDIFVNCIYLTQPIPPFITKEQLTGAQKLSVIADVSCDSTNPHNPLPYYGSTTFENPVIDVNGVSVIAIDHLPTLVPREASDSFATDLLPSLKELKSFDSGNVGQVNGEELDSVWQRAHLLFQKKQSEL